ncbi:MAG TPA: glycosyltransferase family 39 protein, partial [Vicinamibacterales bacterium]|nr:glycosyltransferase family 39 protein [Vicinamibacterales bacterium]
MALNPLSQGAREVLLRSCLLGIVAVAAGLLCYEISEPFVGHHDFNTAYMSTAAGNHLRYGFRATGFGLVMDNGVIDPQSFTYYVDHPPLVPVIVALSFAIFGEHEWSARLIPVAFSLGTVVLVYLLGCRLHGRSLGLISAAIFGLFPMTGYFGRMLNHEAPTNFFAVAAVLAYVAWRSSKTRKTFILMVASLLAGALSGWPAYYLGLLLPLHHAAQSTRKTFDRRILLLPVLCVGLFVLHIAQTVLLQGGDGIATLFEALRLRLSQSAADHGTKPFGWYSFAVRHGVRLMELYTWPALMLASIYAVSQFSRSKRVVGSDRLLVPLLFGFGLIHVALFRQGSWIHDYWMFYLSVPLAMAAGEGAVFLAQWRRGWVLSGAVLLLFAWVAVPKTLDMHTWGDRSGWDLYHVGHLLKAHVRPDEIIVKSAGDAWWDISAPQTL